ncbi:MAG: hypothetical protein ICV56_10240, partial [Nitrososphaeraceae archaeon]|nr:hypothetical protein [Nitrososphaeraceae archaeon]
MWRRSEVNSSLSVRYVYPAEGDERPSEEQRADPIASEGLLNFQKKKIATGGPFDVCVEVSDRPLS